MSLIFMLIIGGIAGWLANLFMKGKGKGLVVNVIIGIVGAVIGGFLFDLLNVPVGGWLGSLVVAFIGSVILLFTARQLSK